MKYYYQKPDICLNIYGSAIDLDHPVYKRGTLFSKDELNLVVVQLHSQDKTFWWGELDPWLANDIYLNKNFPLFFSQHATTGYPIFQVRKVMWALRMKPLPKTEVELFI